MDNEKQLDSVRKLISEINAREDFNENRYKKELKNLEKLDRKYKEDVFVRNPDFEKFKYPEATFFMKIGEIVGISIRNSFYKGFDRCMEEAFEDNELYRVLEAQKNGYFLGSKLEEKIEKNLIEVLSANPLRFLEECSKRDLYIPVEKLFLIFFSIDGENIYKRQNLTDYPHLLLLLDYYENKEEFINNGKILYKKYINSNHVMLTERNPLLYHNKLLNSFSDEEIIKIKEHFLELKNVDEVNQSFKSMKIIDKIIKRIDTKLYGKAPETIEDIINNLPEECKEILNQINEIKFSKDDKELLLECYGIDYSIIKDRVEKAVIKYNEIDEKFRDTLVSISGKSANDLLFETLKDILIVQEDFYQKVNEKKLSDLSIEKNYQEEIKKDLKI